MGKKPWKVMSTLAISASLLLATGCTAKEARKGEKKNENTSNVSVKVKDYNFDNAANMFAYAEFELSGEPLVEGLGLDLDVLDPAKLDSPTKFDYTAGVEAYEYSEEAMYEVVEKSGFGLHLVHGPALKELAEQSGKTPAEELGERYYKLADSVGYPREEIFRNMYPTLIEYTNGDPHYIQEVDTDEYASGENGAYIPNYQVNFESLRWDRNKMDKVLSPSAYGATFLKQSLWAGDFLGGFHTRDKDEELEGETSKDDADKNIALGVSSADGMQGMFLVEGIWNKLNYIRDGLFYDSTKQKLTSANFGKTYDPSKGYVYLPHQLSVEEDGNAEMPNAKAVSIKDKTSELQDQWLMLWPASEFYGMTDQRTINKNVKPSFQAVFDSNPFPSAPAENKDEVANNDKKSSDPFTVNQDVLLHVFKNIDAMHFNKDEKTFVTENDGTKQGTYVDTFQAGYTVEALRIFQRAIDGLPVGYANAEAAKGLNTAEGKRALELITNQADFIMNKLTLKNGLVAKGYNIGEGMDDQITLDAQLGAIRGLTAAFLATNDEKYREAARDIYVAMDENLWDNKAKAYKTEDDKMIYNPYTVGGVAAVYRVAINNLSNLSSDKDQPDALEVEKITERYTDFFDTVIDGPTLDEGMQASEFWDTGDLYYSDKKLGNTDKDQVPQVQAGHGKYGIAPVLVTVEVKKKK